MVLLDFREGADSMPGTGCAEPVDPRCGGQPLHVRVVDMHRLPIEQVIHPTLHVVQGAVQLGDSPIPGGQFTAQPRDLAGQLRHPPGGQVRRRPGHHQKTSQPEKK
jgi:hypothetical protein